MLLWFFCILRIAGTAGMILDLGFGCSCAWSSYAASTHAPFDFVWQDCVFDLGFGMKLWYFLPFTSIMNFCKSSGTWYFSKEFLLNWKTRFCELQWYCRGYGWSSKRWKPQIMLSPVLGIARNNPWFLWFLQSFRSNSYTGRRGPKWPTRWSPRTARMRIRFRKLSATPWSLGELNEPYESYKSYAGINTKQGGVLISFFKPSWERLASWLIFLERH